MTVCWQLTKISTNRVLFSTMEQVCRKTGNNKMNKIAAFAIFGPLRVGFQHLDRCASDFKRYALDFTHFALDSNRYALVFQPVRVGFRPLSVESTTKLSFSA
jgi:hypothetical protein